MEVKRFGLGLDERQVARRAARRGARRSRRSRRSGSRGERTGRAAHRSRRSSAASWRAEPGPAVLHPLRAEDGLVDRADHDLTRIDPWFLDQIAQLVEFEDVLVRLPKLEDVPRRCCGRPSSWATATAAREPLPGLDQDRHDPRRAGHANRWASSRSTSWWTPAPRSSRRSHRTTTRPTRRRSPWVDDFRPQAMPGAPMAPDDDEIRVTDRRRRSSSSAAGRTGSARASSSTTAACTRRSRRSSGSRR
jgi:hypothetical protein